MNEQQRIATTDVLLQVMAERMKQHAKWGEQNHPDGTGEGALDHLMSRSGSHRNTADGARNACQSAFAEGNGTYAHIAWEEIAEAFHEHDPVRLRTEIVQCAAVFVAWIETIDRKAVAND